MRVIRKGQEPRSLAEHRSSAAASYDNLSLSAKQDLRKALAREQGHLCCYCMSRIDPGPERVVMKVEHWASQTRNPELQLVYSNLLGACIGGEGSPHGEQHCDTRKGNSEITVDPRAPSRHAEELRYSHDGTISSPATEIDQQLNEQLNLNTPKLKNNRKEALHEFLRRLQDKHGKSAWPEGAIEREIVLRSTFDKKGKLAPYAGVMLSWLRRRTGRP